ncbi:adenosylcobinamide-GDP ribazoletransferase [Bacillus seohaeanensis]|jgi:adenosylcobinamide-GDP ribazoletransferase|uniref:Adenosylcobinamide-GDP ribazoletransferase n=1 Tax=Bacillus seohaeanensis TaxID=284580 RepID=A0ABW5RTY6_9BACI
MTSYWNAFLLSLQFFSSIPIRKELKMEKDDIRKMIRLFPFFGFVFGLIWLGVFVVVDAFTPLSSLALAFIIWLLPIMLTGGIHLDGWMDVSDAYFSYQDKEKRLEIMKDPRVGAFATLSIFVLLSSKFLFIYESLSHDKEIIYFTLLFIPLISRSFIGAMLINMKTARREGMAFFFRQHLSERENGWILFFLVIAGVVLLSVNSIIFTMFSVFILITVIYYWFANKKTITWFGGMTGDTIGASMEGLECILWMTVWLWQYCVMA